MDFDGVADGAAAETTVATPPPTIPSGYVANFLYFSDDYTEAIMRVNLDDPGSWATPETVITTGHPRHLTIDRQGRKIYWISTDGLIRRANLDGSEVESIVTIPGAKGAIGIDPIPRQSGAAKLYWTQKDDAIYRANLDGSDVEVVVPAGSAWVWRNNLVINTIVGELYWSEGNTGKVYRSDLNGGHVETLVTGLDHPYAAALDVFDNRVYWLTADRIQRAYLDGSGVEDVCDARTSWWDYAHRPLHVDALNGKVYWRDMGARIWQADLDGANAITVTEGVWAYGLATAYQPDPAFVDVYEPNDDFLQAARIGIAGPFTATLFSTGDADAGRRKRAGRHHARAHRRRGEPERELVRARLWRHHQRRPLHAAGPHDLYPHLRAERRLWPGRRHRPGDADHVHHLPRRRPGSLYVYRVAGPTHPH
ncbi:MAG: hypothetical protein DRI48_06595 [Chloroflexi bacterium]|nr:MAG: hypothetical protein DRI48_06595 [Chloroflexota bacterium]